VSYPLSLSAIHLLNITVLLLYVRIVRFIVLLFCFPFPLVLTDFWIQRGYLWGSVHYDETWFRGRARNVPFEENPQSWPSQTTNHKPQTPNLHRLIPSTKQTRTSVSQSCIAVTLHPEDHYLPIRSRCILVLLLHLISSYLLLLPPHLTSHIFRFTACINLWSELTFVWFICVLTRIAAVIDHSTHLHRYRRILRTLDILQHLPHL
jgi:hypothetical protein